ncbi:B3 domain-containing protein [Melia azedarach]|uniref:B3 domain-containing protein n=1 Tax=Melia azedarach TaxID=155640 RepID=A0ACC1XZM4_MELAZ|nr:B3 domain-containing protein [Melia azedarach]
MDLLTQDNRPCFFKIISDGEVPVVRIPPKFLKHISKELSDKATITVLSSGSSWNVEVGETRSGLYLQRGWQKFLRDNSLGDAEFLLFRYDGNMCFSVQVFEKSGCERVGASDSGMHQESAEFPIGKRPRGRPKKAHVNSEQVKNLHLRNLKTIQL